MAVADSHDDRRQRADSVATILMYHRIVAEPSAGPGTVTLQHFEEQLGALGAAGCTALSLAELVSRLERQALPPRAVSLTFDDGYADQIGEVTAALQRRRLPATFFVVGRALEPGYEFWWDTLAGIFDSERRLPSSLTLAGPSGGVELPVDTPAGRREARRQLTDRCYEATLAERDRLLSELIQWASWTAGATPQPLSSRQLADLAAEPDFEIGAHTENHLWLPRQSPHVQEREIGSAKRRLERILGRRVVSLAYPYGAYDDTTRRLARANGFSIAVTTEPRPVALQADRLALPRCEVPDVGAEAFCQLLAATSP